MRVLQTFILRLLIDAGDARALRGSLYAIANGDEYPFVDGAALIDLLEGITRQPNGPDQPNDARVQSGAHSGRDEGVGDG